MGGGAQAIVERSSGRFALSVAAAPSSQFDHHSCGALAPHTPPAITTQLHSLPALTRSDTRHQNARAHHGSERRSSALPHPHRAASGSWLHRCCPALPYHFSPSVSAMSGSGATTPTTGVFKETDSFKQGLALLNSVDEKFLPPVLDRVFRALKDKVRTPALPAPDNHTPSAM